MPGALRRERVRQRHRHTETQTHREGGVRTEAETGVMQRQAKEHQGLQQPPEPRRGAWSGFSLRPPRRDRSCQHVDFGFLVTRTVKEKKMVVVIHFGSLGD